MALLSTKQSHLLREKKMIFARYDSERKSPSIFVKFRRLRKSFLCAQERPWRFHSQCFIGDEIDLEKVFASAAIKTTSCTLNNRMMSRSIVCEFFLIIFCWDSNPFTKSKYHDQEDEPRIKQKRNKPWAWNNGIRPNPYNSGWYKMYVRSTNCGENLVAMRKFRRRFRMPWKQFRWLVETARAEGWFPHHEHEDATGRQGVPLDLLILGSLRYLGRGPNFLT